MKEVIEKLDSIEAQQVAKIEEAKAEAFAKTDAVEVSLTEKLNAIEAKLSEVNAPSIIKIEKTIRGDVNKMVREQLRDFAKSDSKVQKELKVFADESQYEAYMTEASALTGGGAGIGGRTAYDPCIPCVAFG